MSLLSLQNAVILTGPANLSGYTNNVEVSATSEDKDVTTFATQGFKSVLGGLKSIEIMTEGFWDAGNGASPDPTKPDDRLWAEFNTTGNVMTVTPTGAAVGDVSYFTRVLRPNYTFGAEVGEVLPFSSTAMGDGTSLVRGLIADNQARTATGTTTVRTLVAPTASTRVYAAIHILAASGTTPSLTATLQGDDTIGFPSPATVATSSAQTGIGSVWLQGAYGVTADSFYRLSYTISGTSPSFTVIASIGVGT
jgi:hypothetical protein